MTNRILLFFLIFITNLYSSDKIDKYLSLDDATFQKRTINSVPTYKILGETHIPNFEEACHSIYSKTYNNVLINKKEQEYFDDICLLARADFFEWQIYLSYLLYEGRTWLPQDQIISFSYFEKACKRPNIQDEIDTINIKTYEQFLYLAEHFQILCQEGKLTQSMNNLELDDRKQSIF
jgi:hypothetical protein